MMRRLPFLLGFSIWLCGVTAAMVTARLFTEPAGGISAALALNYEFLCIIWLSVNGLFYAAKFLLWAVSKQDIAVVEADAREAAFKEFAQQPQEDARSSGPWRDDSPSTEASQ